jgi:DNA-binding HxlR family transcriptional regulator
MRTEVRATLLGFVSERKAGILASMRAADLSEQHCSIARPATLLGDRWTLVILRQAFSRTRRFDDFQRQLGISRSLLSDRLGKLVEFGILRREPYKDDVRTRDEYRLTEKGLDLYPVLMALREWGDKYMADEGAPIQVHHRGCGGELHTELTCEHCGEEVGARDAEVAPGPGLERLAPAS